MKKTLLLLWGLLVCISVRAQTHPTTDKGCMILDQPGKRLVKKIPGTIPGRMYRVSFKADPGDCDSLLAGAHLQQSSTQWFFSSGEHRFTFTANDTAGLVFFYINAPCRVSICYVKIEEMRIESRIVCTEDSAGYRYGFNGKEKIDEQYGIEGTAYDFGARLYDSRLGRWMAVDPLAGRQPGWSPYKAFLDNPILYADPDGESEIITVIYTDKTTGEKIVLSKEVSTNLFRRPKYPFSPDNMANPSTWHDKQTTYEVTTNDQGQLIMVSQKTEILDPVKVTTLVNNESVAKVTLFLEGKEGKQKGGWHFVTEGGGADPTKWGSLTPVQATKIDGLVEMLGWGGGYSGIPKIGDPLGTTETTQMVRDVVESIKETFFTKNSARTADKPTGNEPGTYPGSFETTDKKTGKHHDSRIIRSSEDSAKTAKEYNLKRYEKK